MSKKPKTPKNPGFLVLSKKIMVFCNPVLNTKDKPRNAWEMRKWWLVIARSFDFAISLAAIFNYLWPVLMVIVNTYYSQTRIFRILKSRDRYWSLFLLCLYDNDNWELRYSRLHCCIRGFLPFLNFSSDCDSSQWERVVVRTFSRKSIDYKSLSYVHNAGKLVVSIDMSTSSSLFT